MCMFPLFNFYGQTTKTFLDYFLDISGSILIPLAIFFIGTIWINCEKERKDKINRLNYLTIYSHNLIHECVKLRQNEARRRNALLQFIKEPSAENYSNAFYIVRTPSLKYDIFAGDYAFVSDKFPQLLNNIFEIDSRLKTIITYISDANRFGDIGASKKTAEQINLAKMLLISLDDFHRNCNWLIFYIDHLLQCIKVYNCSYFFQKLVLIVFQGPVKEVIDNAVNELDDINKFRNPNWKDGLIDDPENPPIKLNLKDYAYIYYLKTMSKIEDYVKKSRKYLYKHENDKFLKEQITTKSFYSNEEIADLNIKYTKELENFTKNKELFESLNINKGENYFFYKGYMRRMEQMIVASKEIFRIFPPERNTLLMPEEIYQTTIYLNYMVTNFIPALNNIFQFLIKHFNPDEDIDDVNFLSKKLNNYTPPGYVEYLQKFYDSDFFQFTEGFDNSISNGLPFELFTHERDKDGTKMPGIQILQYCGENKQGYTVHGWTVTALNSLNKICREVYNMIISSPKLITPEKLMQECLNKCETQPTFS